MTDRGTCTTDAAPALAGPDRNTASAKAVLRSNAEYNTPNEPSGVSNRFSELERNPTCDATFAEAMRVSLDGSTRRMVRSNREKSGEGSSKTDIRAPL